MTEMSMKNRRDADLMIDILSNIIEFRNGESGWHVQHIRILTALLLRRLTELTDRYSLTEEDVARISMASALHDIGKIAISSEILNKPGRLKAEEFSVVKDHAMIGANMLRELPIPMDEPLMRSAYEICRWHHERWDGSGYPDGLKGDECPISAQAVAMADVYDALTTDRVYKKAMPYEAAAQLILDGKSGAFNPLLLESLDNIAALLPGELEEAAGI